MQQSFAQKIQTPKVFQFLLNQVKPWSAQVSIPPTEHCQDQPKACSLLRGEWEGGDPSEPSLGGQLLFLLRKKLWKIYIPSFYLSSTFMSSQAEQNRVISVSSERCHMATPEFTLGTTFIKRWHQPAAFQLHYDTVITAALLEAHVAFLKLLIKWIHGGGMLPSVTHLSRRSNLLKITFLCGAKLKQFLQPELMSW